ncbi:hypothetical protein LIER_04678 [Lithospermum erythrorhizon]|uniref:Uncharacterized protein n=1 Tax=Lithospermum erythrorhizon TaxID=34254 RepID=A0AAV3P2B5_LITER
MEHGTRPNRSDVHLTEEEEAKLEKTTREYFDGIAPPRHTKPRRSEYATEYTDNAAFSSGGATTIPEYLEFQRLEDDPQLSFFLLQKLMANNSEVPMEEFVETEYYTDLNHVDKIHHTTGTGFITMENKSINSIKPELNTEHHASSKGNPATNDWTPAATDNTDDFKSHKPSRSDH